MGISDGILEYWNGGMMGLGFSVQGSRLKTFEL